MAQNRIILYGYKMENGKFIQEPIESQVVTQIFSKYADGYSYKKIAEWLTESEITYTLGKPQWNKNMVARILQNNNYLGNEKYPAIVKQELYQQATLQAKPYTHTANKDIKTLKPLLICSECGEPISRRLKAKGDERWYCPSSTAHISLNLTDEILLESILYLQKKLTQYPKREVLQNNNKTINIELIKLKNQIDISLSESEPNFDEIKDNIMKLASEKFNMLSSSIADDDVINLAINKLNSTTLNSQLIREICTSIVVTHNTATSLILKNNGIIKR